MCVDGGLAHRRRVLGEPESRHSGDWASRLNWFEGYNLKKSGHRPDLIAWAPSEDVFAIEVELAQKSRARLNAILSLHNHWILQGKLQALFYVVGDEDAARRIRNGMRRNIFLTDGRVRIELLDTIKQQAIQGFETKRARRDEHALLQSEDRPETVAATAPGSPVHPPDPSAESDHSVVTSTTAGIAWKWTTSHE
jgi:hypothetical protein